MDFEYKNKPYSFSKRSSTLFIFLCPTIALSIVLITFFLKLYLDPLYVYPATMLLNLFTGKTAELTLNIYNNISLRIPDSIGVYFAYGCSPYPAFALFFAICLMAPQNEMEKGGNNFLKRKFITFIVSFTVVFIVNTFRIAITIYLYHIGLPYYPMHDILEYFNTFIAVFIFFSCCYYWIPEIIISGISSIEKIKYKILKRKSTRDSFDSQQTKNIKMTYILLVWMPICIFIGTSFSILIYLRIF